MGEEIEVERFGPDDRERFARRLRDGVTALERTVARPGFGAGATTVGAELEVGLVGPDARPAPVNDAVRADAGPGVDLELDRFNLEVGTPPVPLAGRPFEALAAGLEGELARLRRAAARHGARVAAIGILPTLREDDLGPAALSDSPRFRALSAGLRELRGGPFRISLEGDEALSLEWDDVTLEGAATGFHVHLRVLPERFADVFNAMQAVSAPVLAASTNSPLLLGRMLWAETRIGLFHQAVDDRTGGATAWRPARVSFGHGWVRVGAPELFAESCALHVPLLPVCGGEEPLGAEGPGRAPELSELRLHHGTVWRWNRAVYAPGDDPHLRVELRCLPGGPTVTDMMANAALAVGAALALAPRCGRLTAALPFELARRNFYVAARDGLEAVMLWPSTDAAPSPRPLPVSEVLADLVPLARGGLVAAGVEADEADRLLGVIEARVATRSTGSAWQRRELRRRERRMPRPRALAAMTEAYLEHSAAGDPVHLWPAAPGSG